MLFHEQPSEPWNAFDFMLVEALQILEDETCGKCGNPIWICRNSDATHLGFKIKTSVCYASAEMEKWQEKKEKNKDGNKLQLYIQKQKGQNTKNFIMFQDIMVYIQIIYTKLYG